MYHAILLLSEVHVMLRFYMYNVYDVCYSKGRINIESNRPAQQPTLDAAGITATGYSSIIETDGNPTYDFLHETSAGSPSVVAPEPHYITPS